MDHWRTTVAGICAAIGSVLQHAPGVPPWVALLGECLTAAGMATLGLLAADKNPRGSSEITTPSTTTNNTMKTLVPLILIITASVLLCGCAGAGVPATNITLPTAKGPMTIHSPKDTSWTNIVVEFKPDGSMKASIGSVTSYNDKEVVGTIANANANMLHDSLDTINKLVNSPAGQAAIKAASGGVAP